MAIKGRDSGKHPLIQLDEIDKAILRILQKDAKMNIKEIAAEVGITKTPIYERIRRLEKTGVITRYVAQIDRRRGERPDHRDPQGRGEVTLDVQKAEYIEDFARAVDVMPEVMECYLAGGGFDFLLKVVVSDLDAYHEFASHRLAALPNVRTIKSSFVLSEYKHSTVFPLL